MDDLFDGYIVLDGIGDFLGNSAPANDPKAPDDVPQTIHHAGVSKQPIRPKETNVNGSDQSPFSTQKGLDTIAMDTAFTKFPEVDQELLQEALLSLKSLSSIMDGTGIHSIEKAIVGQLTETLRLLLHSDLEIETDELPIPRDSPLGLFPFANPILPQDFGLVFDNIDWENVTDPLPGAPYPIRSFAAMMVILTIFSTWPHEALMRMFDRTNQLGNVIMAHFCAVRFILSSIAAPKMALKTPTRATVQWNALIIAAIDDDESGEWTKYVEWPGKILRCMEACCERHKGFTMDDVRSMLLNDPGAFKEGRARRY
ncbi:hypothetical protein J4E89_002952 [Alternaria sp. Ai002NY15]|nr:hypothetical protein J4E89_002952 [Alternaria sp. Ai002NY15]